MPLRQAGLVHGLRGAHGGYVLARPPDTISVGEVIRAVEGALDPDALRSGRLVYAL